MYRCDRATGSIEWVELSLQVKLCKKDKCSATVNWYIVKFTAQKTIWVFQCSSDAHAHAGIVRVVKPLGKKRYVNLTHALVHAWLSSAKRPNQFYVRWGRGRETGTFLFSHNNKNALRLRQLWLRRQKHRSLSFWAVTNNRKSNIKKGIIMKALTWSHIYTQAQHLAIFVSTGITHTPNACRKLLIFLIVI